MEANNKLILQTGDEGPLCEIRVASAAYEKATRLSMPFFVPRLPSLATTN